MFSQSYQQSPAPPPANQTTAVVQMPVQSPIPAPAQAIPTQQQQHRMSYNQSPQQVILTAPAQPNSDTQPQSQTMPNFPNSSGAIVISTPTPPPSTTPSMAPPNVVFSVFSQAQALPTQQSQPIMFSQSYQQSPAPPPANQTTAVVQMPVQSPIPAPAQAIPTQQQQHRMSYNQSPQQVILTAPAQPNSDTQAQSQTMPNFPNSSGAIVISTPTPPPSTTPSMAPPNVVISSNARAPHLAVSLEILFFDSKRLIELVQEVDPSLQIDEDVEDFLLQLADEFIEQVASKACQLAKHRGSSTLDAKDIQLTLERDWHYYVPGYVSDDVKSTRKSHVTEAHRQRMAIIKQQTGKK